MKNIKIVILDLVIADLISQINNADKARLEALEVSRTHKGAMESRYDTFKEEAQYLAGGYSTKLTELAEKLEVLKRIRANQPFVTKGSCYSIVEVKNLENGVIQKFFLLSSGKGETYNVEGEEIIVLDINAPLARTFLGVVSGSEVETKIGGKVKKFFVISVT